MNMDQEVIYGTSDDSHAVMSEKVQFLAGSIYQEFERMIAKYDQDVVKDLMPLVVNVLECLDLAYTENQEHEVELELLRDDNEQLATQYEREKQLRKSLDEKTFEAEDKLEDKKEKIVSLESIVRMLEMKAKNSSDHVSRLEEREQEIKKEYAKLHERYTELFKTHMDCMERTKLLMGSTDKMDMPCRPRLPGLSINPMSRSTGPVSFGFASLESGPVVKSMSNSAEFTSIPQTSTPEATNLRTELSALSNADSIIEDVEPEVADREELPKVTSEKGRSETFGDVSKDNSPNQDLPEDSVSANVTPSHAASGKSHTKREQRSANTLYQELSFQDSEALEEMDEGADITGNWVHPGDYASSESENEMETEPPVNDNFFGMGKEVENLIMENNELLETKNALNVVKDDLIVKVDELTSKIEMLQDELKSLLTLKTKHLSRITELEENMKRLKEDLEKCGKSNKSDDDEDTPMAQRKRFTRVEMARVLMERNQYKEKYIELQEAIRWTETVRATKQDSNSEKKKLGIIKFFQGIFGGNESKTVGNTAQESSSSSIYYRAPTHHISPQPLASTRRRPDHLNEGEKIGLRRSSERKDGTRQIQIRAHIPKDDGRMRAYGWSLPSKSNSNSTPAPSSMTVPVPVPVYCRPLMEYEPGMKLWCATGVNLSGGLTRDGGSIVGASVFYANTASQKDVNDVESAVDERNHDEGEKENEEIQKLDEELKEGEKLRLENDIPDIQKLSSLVWICTTKKSTAGPPNKSSKLTSKISIVDANNASDILHSFSMSQVQLICIASVPGAKETDYTVGIEQGTNLEEANYEKEITVENGNQTPSLQCEGEDPDEKSIGKITFVSCASGSEVPPVVIDDEDDDAVEELTTQTTEKIDLAETVETDADDKKGQRRPSKEISEGLVKDGLTDLPKEIEKLSSILPTIWLGSQNGYIFVHSAVSQWRRCLHSIKLKDSVLSIVHVLGRVICALANGSIVVFRRGSDGQWDLTKYHAISLGSAKISVRCLAGVHSKVWCGYKNKIHVLDVKTLTVQKSIEAHPRKESQVRQMAWLGDGVWVSIRLDSTLRMYHAHTYQHLQDVDIEPYVSKMLGAGKLGFSFVRITALLISSLRLWIGTGNGVIISVPLSENAGNSTTMATGRVPGGVVRIYSDPNTAQITPGSFIPYCSMSQAQLSFHGYRDAVKFFVAVPGNGGLSAATTIRRDSPVVENVSETKVLPSMLVISGGEGYIDFRTNSEDVDNFKLESEHNLGHIFIWKLTPLKKI